MKTLSETAFLGVLGATLVVLTACHAGEIDARANAKVAESCSVAERAIDYVRCADGARFGPNCGLILRLAASDDFRARFRDKVCSNTSTEECDTAYRRLIDAELGKRYYAADWQAVARECDRRPGYCDDGRAYEKLLLGSHNMRVQATYADDEGRIDDERAAEHRADEASGMALAGALLDTTTVLAGGKVCHSYPSVFGGMDTVCPP